MIIKFDSVTKTQLNYIQTLFDDCGFSASQKRAFLLDKYNCNYSDELTKWQASLLIDSLKEIKEFKESRM